MIVGEINLRSYTKGFSNFQLNYLLLVLYFLSFYVRYENEKRYKRQIKARELWGRIITSQIETGLPYMVYKDACNSKSNQQNLGTIKCSNLCTEIVEYTSPEEVAVCNLASIALPRFVVIDESSKQNGDKEVIYLYKKINIFLNLFCFYLAYLVKL